MFTTTLSTKQGQVKEVISKELTYFLRWQEGRYIGNILRWVIDYLVDSYEPINELEYE